jgi:hypothetical protein
VKAITLWQYLFTQSHTHKLCLRNISLNRVITRNAPTCTLSGFHSLGYKFSHALYNFRECRFHRSPFLRSGALKLNLSAVLRDIRLICADNCFYSSLFTLYRRTYKLGKLPKVVFAVSQSDFVNRLYSKMPFTQFHFSATTLNAESGQILYGLIYSINVGAIHSYFSVIAILPRFQFVETCIPFAIKQSSEPKSDFPIRRWRIINSFLVSSVFATLANTPIFTSFQSGLYDHIKCAFHRTCKCFRKVFIFDAKPYGIRIPPVTFQYTSYVCKQNDTGTSERDLRES